MENAEKLTLVIPVYNEEKTLPELWNRLKTTLAPTGMSWRILFINDGSSDSSLSIITRLAAEHKEITCCTLSRNFGHQAALTAGLDHASGDAIVLMDGDLQDRPEAIPDFISEWKNGADVVYAIRANRKENLLSRVAFKSFYLAITKLSGIKQPPDAGIFCLIDKRVLSVINAMPEHNRYFPGLRAFAGFSQKGVTVERDERFAGSPRVGIKGLVKLAFDAIFSFSYLPLRLTTFFGLFVASFSFVYLAWVLYQKFFTQRAIEGWTSTLGAVLLLGGIQLIMIGIVGEYVGRVYEETKRRPAYIIDQRIPTEGDE